MHTGHAGSAAVAAVHLPTVWGQLAHPPRPEVGLQRRKLCLLRRLKWQPVHRLPLFYSPQHCSAEDLGSLGSACACSTCHGAHSGHLVRLTVLHSVSAAACLVKALFVAGPLLWLC